MTPKLGWFERFYPLVFLSRNWISLTGMVLVTAAAILWIGLMPLLLHGATQNPYSGLLLFVALPGMFFAGLVLIPIGIWWARRSTPIPTEIDIRTPRVRQVFTFVALATFANVIIASQLTYGAVNYMESQSFCGATCHVMAPEFAAFKHGPHSNVECTKCHAGPGAQGFVMSKLAGTRQLFELVTNTYPRPIPPPSVHKLSSVDTCENCHSSTRQLPDKLVTIPKFADDETSSRTDSVLLLHVANIHAAHYGPNVKIEFAFSDPQHPTAATIPWVQRTLNGKVTVYQTKDGKKSEELRTMDCTDCHSRPAHAFELPNRAIDRSMASGTIAADLPQVKKQAQAALESGKLNEFAQFYQTRYPEVYNARRSAIEKAAAELMAISSRNIFPAMNVKWGSYPQQLGHTDSPGCYRCHDDLHLAAGGIKINQDCTSCHSLVAMDEAKPKILTDLGIAGTK